MSAIHLLSPDIVASLPVDVVLLHRALAWCLRSDLSRHWTLLMRTVRPVVLLSIRLLYRMWEHTPLSRKIPSILPALENNSDLFRTSNSAHPTMNAAGRTCGSHGRPNHSANPYVRRGTSCDCECLTPTPSKPQRGGFVHYGRQPSSFKLQASGQASVSRSMRRALRAKPGPRIASLFQDWCVHPGDVPTQDEIPDSSVISASVRWVLRTMYPANRFPR
ncbi:hypothetical protein OF83DRAFT_1149854 [Amylostereum chailletii]|nr:hypothetical protein OF83DRAFT_1149854 [Amylostereum chailletii]